MTFLSDMDQLHAKATRRKMTGGVFVIVDNDVMDEIFKRKWRVNYEGYAIRTTAKFVNGKRIDRELRMHRVIMGAKDGEIIDHINGNKLDNRKCNLRFASRSINSLNRRLANSNSKVGLLGVKKRYGKYEASCKVNGKSVPIGSFATARAAYDARMSYVSNLLAKLNEGKP